MTPRPMPGYTRALLPAREKGSISAIGETVDWEKEERPWPVTKVRPLNSTGGKGEPLPKTARPSEWTMASSAVHSECLVGLLRAKMTGVCCSEAIFWMMAGLKEPACPETPMMESGLNCTGEEGSMYEMSRKEEEEEERQGRRRGKEEGGEEERQGRWRRGKRIKKKRENEKREKSQQQKRRDRQSLSTARKCQAGGKKKREETAKEKGKHEMPALLCLVGEEKESPWPLFLFFALLCRFLLLSRKNEGEKEKKCGQRTASRHSSKVFRGA